MSRGETSSTTWAASWTPSEGLMGMSSPTCRSCSTTTAKSLRSRWVLRRASLPATRSVLCSGARRGRGLDLPGTAPYRADKSRVVAESAQGGLEASAASQEQTNLGPAARLATTNGTCVRHARRARRGLTLSRRPLGSSAGVAKCAHGRSASEPPGGDVTQGRPGNGSHGSNDENQRYRCAPTFRQPWLPCWTLGYFALFLTS